ncbi:GNAT family N-acetyltransferase [Kiloniella sp. EL199]|uniref:GNAT family N-acetyltransferase n=1 Tax=Kiloniella sp. EL199 TaxID=2107581 RepID=UPI000EA1B950|nr:GNAT family N-acetyltransferase [Kiloniella sp. EL199]
MHAKISSTQALAGSNILVTERLTLRPFSSKDGDILFQLYGNAQVMAIRKIGTQTPQGSDKQLGIITDHWLRRGFGLWAVFDREQNVFMGECGLREENETDEIVELSYGLLPEFWGGGLATEAVMAVLAFGKETLGMKKIHAYAQKKNAVSLHILSKFGFQHEYDFDEDGEMITRTILEVN